MKRGGSEVRERGQVWGWAMSFALMMTIIQRLLWLCSDKKAFFYALIYHGPSQEALV